MHMASRAIGVILLCVAATQAYAAAVAFPERGRSAVVDAAGVIPEGAEAALEARLVAWNRSTGHQLVVATVPSLEGLEIQDYGVGLLRHWRLGRAGANDGVILLLAPTERQVRIEVGYGLEPVLTDARTSAIIREAIRPSLRAGDAAGALTAGAERIMQAVASGADEPVQAPPREANSPLSWWWIVFGGLGCLVLAVFLYPIFETWYAIWPFYALMPARAKRAELRHQANMAKRRRRGDTRPAPATDGPTNNLSTVRTMAAAMRARLDKQRERTRHARSSRGSDALAALRDRAQASSSNDSYDGGSSDPGFDGGGGSGGGGGADSDY
jgi:uncharacterized membrane protein YgcG